VNGLAWSAGLEAKDWVSSGLAALALLVSAAGLWFAGRSVRAANRSATEAARSANAAERQAEAAERQARAAEAMTSADLRIAPGPAPAVAWTLTRVGKTSYRLRNIGTEPAVRVRVAGLPADAGWLVRFAGADVMAGHAADVTVLQVWGTAVDVLEVTWDGGGPAVLPVENGT
jgi:hypothetical protein